MAATPTRSSEATRSTTSSLADSEPLVHVGAALIDGATTAGDLVRGEAFSWANPPDPDAFFQTRYERHVALPALTGTPRELRVLTYNVGLLSRRYAVFSKVEVPEIDARRAIVGDTVFAAGYDVVFFQEAWEKDDLAAIIASGEAAGYSVWGGDGNKFHKETGTIIAVKSELIGGEETREQGQYEAQWGLENFPGPNLKRGWLERSFPLADTGITVHLYDTHPTAFADEWQVRNLQARELGLKVAAEPAEDLVLVGGDLNAGWYYAGDTWTDAEGTVIPDWFANATMLPILLHYGGLDDAKNAASPNEDVLLGNTVPRDNGATMLEEPFGDATFCTNTEPTTFTATDCNSLYFRNYAGTEFPARLDQILYRDGTGRVRFVDQALAFVEPMDFGDAGTFELSDHYGVEVTLQIGE